MTLMGEMRDCAQRGRLEVLENLNLKGKSVTLRSSDPNDPSVVGATVICGDGRGPVVTLSSGEGRPRFSMV